MSTSIDYQKHTTSLLNVSAFSQIGFLYSVTQQDLDHYFSKTYKDFKKANALRDKLLHEFHDLLAHKQTGHFPEDIHNLSEEMFPANSSLQERYNFAVSKLDERISWLDQEIKNHEATRLFNIRQSPQTECLDWFNCPTTACKSECTYKWKSYDHLYGSFGCAVRGNLIRSFVREAQWRRDLNYVPRIEKSVSKTNKYYQIRLRVLSKKKRKLQPPGVLSDSSDKECEESVDVISQLLEQLSVCINRD